jgi:hypothetical protein
MKMWSCGILCPCCDRLVPVYETSWRHNPDDRNSNVNIPDRNPIQLRILYTQRLVVEIAINIMFINGFVIDNQ